MHLGSDNRWVTLLDGCAAERAGEGMIPGSEKRGLGEMTAQLLAESIPHIVWISAPDGSTTYFNRRGTEYTGCPPEANYGWNWVGLIHPDDAERSREGWEAATHSGTEFHLEYRIRRFDGCYRWHSSRAMPLRDNHGAIYLWLGTATDIEEQKQLELSLRASERLAQETLTLLRSIENAAPVGSKIVDRDLRVIRINQRLAALNGDAVEDCVGKTVSEMVPDLWPHIRGAYQRALDGESVSNIELSTPDREDPTRDRYWLASYYPIRIDGEIVAVGNVVIDITERKEAEQTIARNLDAMVQTIARTVEARDPYTAGHQRRVATLAASIATELDLPPSEVEGIRTAALIHDLGKISVPGEILSKPGHLSGPEYELIKQHVEAGYNIVADIEFPWPVAEMIRQHHERLDGSGYPRGLKDADILLGSKIIAVADTVEAMTARRPYRSGHGLKAALQQIEQDRSALLDENVVDACIRLLQSGQFSWSS